MKGYSGKNINAKKYKTSKGTISSDAGSGCKGPHCGATRGQGDKKEKGYDSGSKSY